jgi:hypothetical protein
MTDTYTKEIPLEEGEKYIETYSANGQVLQRDGYDADGVLTDKVVYVYDQEGKEVERLVYGSDFVKPRTRLVYFYDNEGRLIKSTEYGHEDQLVYTYLYEHDKQEGKINVKTLDKNGDPIKEALEYGI